MARTSSLQAQFCHSDPGRRALVARRSPGQRAQAISSFEKDWARLKRERTGPARLRDALDRFGNSHRHWELRLMLASRQGAWHRRSATTAETLTYGRRGGCSRLPEFRALVTLSIHPSVAPSPAIKSMPLRYFDVPPRAIHVTCAVGRKAIWGFDTDIRRCPRVRGPPQRCFCGSFSALERRSRHLTCLYGDLSPRILDGAPLAKHRCRRKRDHDKFDEWRTN